MSELWQAVFVLLFLFVLVEGLAVLALARTIGLLQIRLGPEPGPLQTADGLALYSEAPAITGIDMRTEHSAQINVLHGRWAIVFLSATCRVCRTLLPDAAQVDRSMGTRVVVVAQGSYEQNTVLKKLAPKLMLFTDPNGDMAKLYGVDTTPFAFLVEDGRIQAKGIVNHRDHLEALLERKTTERPDALWRLAGTAAGVDKAEQPS